MHALVPPSGLLLLLQVVAAVVSLTTTCGWRLPRCHLQSLQLQLESQHERRRQLLLPL
jgi:hypothetical protein